MSLRSVLASVFLLLVGVSVAAPREWTDVLGRTRNGEFVRLEDGNVVIEGGGGTFSVRLHNLSPLDQEYVRDKLSQSGPFDWPLDPGNTGPVDGGATAPSSGGTSSSAMDTGLPPQGLSADQSMRMWIDIKDNTWEAGFTEVRGEDVFFFTQSGMTFRFPFWQLSNSDQNFVRAHLQTNSPKNTTKKKQREKPKFFLPAWAWAVLGLGLVLLLVAIVIVTIQRLATTA